MPINGQAVGEHHPVERNFRDDLLNDVPILATDPDRRDLAILLEFFQSAIRIKNVLQPPLGVGCRFAPCRYSSGSWTETSCVV